LMAFGSIQFGCFLRDKKVVGVFVRFRALCLVFWIDCGYNSE
jgi:hypothetical protein